MTKSALTKIGAALAVGIGLAVFVVARLPSTVAPPASVDWMESTWVDETGTNRFAVELGFSADGRMLWRKGRRLK